MKLTEKRIALADLAKFIGIVLREAIAPVDRPSEEKVNLIFGFNPDPDPGSDLNPGPGPVGNPGPGGSIEEERRAEDAEKRRQEAIDNILSYDLTAARKAVRHDAEEE